MAQRTGRKKGARPTGLVWMPRVELTKGEAFVCKRLTRVGRLFAFLRKHRRELFDDAFQAELATMYADRSRGTPPRPPAFMAMVVLLQAYEQKSDAAAVEETVFDRRWQMVLDCAGAQEPPFSQGVLVEFRRRLIESGLDRRLIERTVELAQKTGESGYKQLRVALDSSPLWGAGRVEDTFNLIGHALEVVVDCAAVVLHIDEAAVRREAGLTLVGGSSLKAALDIDWDDAQAQQDALERLLGEVRRLKTWLSDRVGEGANDPPLREALELLERIIEQDLEPDPDGGGRMRIKRGVSRDRRISVTDGDMRHGRKSKSRVINGYKRHIARELDHGLILAATVRPANEPEQQAADIMRPDIERFGPLAELHVDRAFLGSELAVEMHDTGRRLLAKPWPVRNGNRFPKTDFDIDLESGVVRCPEGQLAVIRGRTARFDGDTCRRCPSRDRCTRSKLGRGRSIAIHPHENMLSSLRRLKSRPGGRAALRERVAIEHALAHVGQRQGRRARYRTARKNTFDLRRVAAVENLHTIERMCRAA